MTAQLCNLNRSIVLWLVERLVKFIYSEKATFYEISTLYLTVCIVVKFKVEISQNFVAFSEYMNFKETLLNLVDHTRILLKKG